MSAIPDTMVPDEDIVPPTAPQEKEDEKKEETSKSSEEVVDKPAEDESAAKTEVVVGDTQVIVDQAPQSPSIIRPSEPEVVSDTQPVEATLPVNVNS